MIGKMKQEGDKLIMRSNVSENEGEDMFCDNESYQ